MNNTRRDEIARIQVLVTAALATLGEAKQILEDAKADEEETFSSASQGKQDGDWGQESQACTDAMQTLIDEIESIDLSEAMDELGRAIDRCLEAPKGRLTKKEAEMRRMQRLPKWALDELSRAAHGKAVAEEKQKAGFKDWVEGSRKPMFGVWKGPLEGKEIPCDRIKFPQVGLTLYIENGSLCLHAENALQLVPSSGNVAYAKSRHWRDL